MGLREISYSRFRVHQYDPADMEQATSFPLPFNPGVQIKGYGTEIDEPAGQIVIEDFLPGTEFNWQFAHDEMQYCISGQAEIEFFHPPLYSDSVKAQLGPGSMYLLPQGGRMQIKVIGDEPYRHICFCYPGPRYPFPPAASIGK